MLNACPIGTELRSGPWLLANLGAEKRCHQSLKQFGAWVCLITGLETALRASVYRLLYICTQLAQYCPDAQSLPTWQRSIFDNLVEPARFGARARALSEAIFSPHDFQRNSEPHRRFGCSRPNYSPASQEFRQFGEQFGPIPGSKPSQVMGT